MPPPIADYRVVDLYYEWMKENCYKKGNCAKFNLREDKSCPIQAEIDRSLFSEKHDITQRVKDTILEPCPYAYYGELPPKKYSNSIDIDLAKELYRKYGSVHSVVVLLNVHKKRVREIVKYMRNKKIKRKRR